MLNQHILKDDAVVSMAKKMVDECSDDDIDDVSMVIIYCILL